MRIRKNILSVLLVMLALVGCGKTNSKTETREINSASDLVASIEEYEAANNEDEKEVLEESKQNKEAEETEVAKKPVEHREGSEEDSQTPASEMKTIKIKAVGDIMAHNIQNQYAYNKGGGTYDFSDSFTYLKDFISDSDIAIGNYETTTNPNLAYAGYPRFNTPPEYITAIADAGFDALATANNHSLDTEVEGLISTIDHIEAAGLDYFGTQRDESTRILYKNIDGVKLAFLGYTFGANGREDLLQVREEVPQLNYLNDEKIESDIRRAKAQGADFVIVYPHWGIEYQSYPNERQKELGRNMIEWGADLVIGNHPHVVQPYEYVETSDGRTGFIAYACGNFISFQNLENNGDIRVEQAVAYEIDLAKDMTTGATDILTIEAHPLWVGVTYNDYGTSVQTYLASDFLEGGKYYDRVDENKRSRIKQSFDMTVNTIESEV